MISGLALLLALTAEPCAGGRCAPLDSLAAHLLAMDRIPRGPELLHLAARNAWVWPLESVSVQRGFTGEPDPSRVWGMAESSLGVCIIMAPPPLVVPDTPVPFQVSPGDSLHLHAAQVPPGLRGAALSPTLRLVYPDSGVLALDEPGTWWVEMMADTEYGPQVILLTPVSAGAPGGWPGNPWRRDEILQGINALRRKLSAPPLKPCGFLQGLARIRALQARNWGGAFHRTPDHAGAAEAIPETLGAWAENIAVGADPTEAAQMILLSPFHFAACTDPRYRRAGLGVVSSPWGTTLVLLLAVDNGMELP